MLALVLSCFVSSANVADVKAASVVLVPALDANSRIAKILALQKLSRQLGQSSSNHP